MVLSSDSHVHRRSVAGLKSVLSRNKCRMVGRHVSPIITKRQENEEENGRSKGRVLLSNLAFSTFSWSEKCRAGHSAYGFLQGAWPFGLVEAIRSLVAVRRWITNRQVANRAS